MSTSPSPRLHNTLPSLTESIVMIVLLAVWLAVTALCVGFRPEHLYLAALIALLFFACGPTRRLVVALLPFIIFGISYDWMNIVPNYEVNSVDIEGLYNSEKSLFGITCADGVVRTPNEFSPCTTRHGSMPLPGSSICAGYLCLSFSVYGSISITRTACTSTSRWYSCW